MSLKLDALEKLKSGYSVGSPHDLKLRSSATLFASACAPDSVFHRLLEKFYPGGHYKETLRLLGISKLSSK